MCKRYVTSIKSHEQFNVENLMGEEEGSKSTDDESVGTMSDNDDL